MTRPSYIRTLKQ